jgi:hypothetical protein
MRELCYICLNRFAALFRRRRLDDDLDEELRSHLELAVERSQQPTVYYNEVSPGYFATLGIPLISGREFAPPTMKPLCPLPL